MQKALKTQFVLTWYDYHFVVMGKWAFSPVLWNALPAEKLEPPICTGILLAFEDIPVYTAIPLNSHPEHPIFNCCVILMQYSGTEHLNCGCFYFNFSAPGFL